jgi:hypothetical protein
MYVFYLFPILIQFHLSFRISDPPPDTSQITDDVDDDIEPPDDEGEFDEPDMDPESEPDMSEPDLDAEPELEPEGSDFENDDPEPPLGDLSNGKICLYYAKAQSHRPISRFRLCYGKSIYTKLGEWQIYPC